MSDFIGPNLYQIVSSGADTCKLELTDGSNKDGTKVQVYNYEAHVHGTWVIASVGLGKSNKEEYLILNQKSGTYLTSPADAKKGETVTGNTISPFDVRVRWNIIPLRNKTSKYIIAPVTNNKMCLNIAGGGTKNGTNIILWDSNKTDSNSHWYLRLAPDAISNSPDVV